MTPQALVLLVFALVAVSATNYFNIGAIFSPFNADGTQNDDEIQAIAAFMLAIRYVNSDPSFFPGYTVRGTIRMSTGTISSFNSAMDLIQNAFGSGVDVVMSTAQSNGRLQLTTDMQSGSFALEDVLKEFSFSHMALNDTNPGLSVGLQFTNHIRIVPGLNYEVLSYDSTLPSNKLRLGISMEQDYLRAFWL